MHRTCIGIIDATRARLFTLDRNADGGTVHEDMVEVVDLVNPARHLPASRGFPYDDHGDARMAELDRTFAKQIAKEIGGILADRRARRLVVCATPGMLGELRQAASFARDGLEIEEIARDLAQLTAPQIRTKLGEYGVLPA